MQYNKNPISLREGHVFIDGVEVMDDVKMNINFTPEVWTGRQLNEKTPSSRWVGATITGSMTRRRTNNWLKTKINPIDSIKFFIIYTPSNLYESSPSIFVTITINSTTIFPSHASPSSS